MATFYLSAHGSARAVTTPNFSSCSNPSGTVRVSYPSGTHGIAGKTETYTGSDTVYNLGSDTHVQCFCAVDGAGIQTNWWRVSSLTEEEVQILKNTGWTLVPNGALWGLEEVPYLTINSNYSCQASNTSNNGSSNSSSSSTDGSVLGSVLGEVLGLAFTGSNLLFYGLIILGITSLLTGLYLEKKRS